MGGHSYNEAYGVSVDTRNRIVVSGASTERWGSPIRPPFPDQITSFVAQLTPDYSNTWMPFARSR